jgi:uncharacterized C2H2 Zn-finger protein
MEYIIHNPKSYNGKQTPDIKGFSWANSDWEELKSNSMVRYPDHVAKELLRRYGFLERVFPEDVERVLSEMNSPEFPCEYCEEVFKSEKELSTHVLRTHKLSEEAKEKMKSIPVAKERVVVGAKPKEANPEMSEGIPDTKKGEVDGWYGPGLEEDMPDSMDTKGVGHSGVFGG